MGSKTGLAVAECRWFDDGNDSVRPLFEVLSGIVENNPHDFRYDMFSEERSLAAVLTDICQDKSLHALYIASHGSENSICGLGDAEISRTKLRNIIVSSNKKARLSGLYFGSCLVASRPNADFLLSKTPKSNLSWVAGYGKTVDWIDSSAVDMIFWSKYLHERKRNRSRRKGKKSELQMAHHAANEMKTLMPTVFGQLGFNVYFRDSGGALSSVW